MVLLIVCGLDSPDIAMVTSNLRIPRSGSTTPACTGTCHVTKCRACYYSQEVHACPRSCRYGCGEDPSRRCFKEWSKCVKKGLGKMVSQRHGPHVCMLCIWLFSSWWLKCWPISSQSNTCIVCACGLTELIYLHPLLPFPQTGRKSASLFKCVDPCTCWSP